MHFLQHTTILALLKRELLTTLRGGRAYAFMAFLVLLLIATALLFLDANQYRGTSFSAQESRAFFAFLVISLFIAGSLLIPPLAAVSICVENQQGSLDMLRVTRATPFAIALAKIAGVMGMYTLLLAAALPFFGVLFFFAGLEISQVLGSTLLAYAGALSATALGIACSAYFHRTLPAILVAFGLIISLHYGLLGFIIVATETFIDGTALDKWIMRHDEAFIVVLSPAGALFSVGVEGFGGVQELSCIAIQLLAAVLALLWTVSLLYRPSRGPRLDTQKPIDDPGELDARRKRFPYYLLDPRRRRPLIPDWRNPIYIKEVRSSAAGRGAWRVRIALLFGLCCFLLSLYAIRSWLDDPRYLRPSMTPTMIAAVLLLLAAPPLIAVAVPKEFESGNIDMLRMTLLRPFHIAAGKFGAALVALAPLAVGVLVGAIPLVIVGFGPVYSDVAATMVCLLYTVALVAAVTATARRTAAGLSLGYGAMLFAHAGLPLLVLYFVENAAPRYFSLRIDDIGAASFFSPLWARIYVDSSTRYGLTPYGISEYGLANSAVFSFLTIPLLGIAYWRFQRQFNRS